MERKAGGPFAVRLGSVVNQPAPTRNQAGVRIADTVLVIAFLDPSQTGAIGAKPPQPRSSPGYNAFRLPGTISAYGRQLLGKTSIQIHPPECIGAGQKNGAA